MHQQSTEILCPDVRTPIHLLPCLAIYSIETCSDRALKEVTAGDTFLALDKSVDKTIVSKDCGSDGRFASGIKAVNDQIGW